MGTQGYIETNSLRVEYLISVLRKDANKAVKDIGTTDSFTQWD